jgi:hypothetical protein
VTSDEWSSAQQQPVSGYFGTGQRHAAELVAEESADGIDLLGFDVDTEDFTQILERYPRGHPEPSVFELLDGCYLVRVVFVGDLPDDLLDDVLDGHQARDAAVLVDQQRHVVSVSLHLGEKTVERLGVRHEHRRTHQFGDLYASPTVGGVIRLLHKVFEVHHADDIVHVLADHRDAGVPTAHGQRRRLPRRLVGFDPHHLGPRHHDLAGRGIAQLEYRLNHSAFVVGHDSALARHVDQLT